MQLLEVKNCITENKGSEELDQMQLKGHLGQSLTKCQYAHYPSYIKDQTSMCVCAQGYGYIHRGNAFVSKR